MADEFDPRYDPAFQPGYDPAQSSRSGDMPAAAVDPADPDAAHPNAAGRDDMEPQLELELEPVNPTPWERTLWIVAGALVVLGVALTFWANSPRNFAGDSYEPWLAILQASAWSLSTPMITVGLGAGVGLLFRRAFVWRQPE